MKNYSEKKRGFILLIALSVLAALTLLVVHLLEAVQLEKELSNNYSNKARSRLMAKSGIEYTMALIISKSAVKGDIDFEGDELAVGIGTFALDSDNFKLDVKDSNAKININDGMEAGYLEMTEDAKRDDVPDWTYAADELDPWPESDPAFTALPENGKSGLLNLRLRRLLNAYGDAHIAESYRNQSDLTEWEYDVAFGSGLPGGLEFRSSATGDRGTTMPDPVTDQGLGDVIIINRTQMGYKALREIKNMVNTWGTDNLPSTYLDNETFYDKVTVDLTVRSYEDDKFNRLRTETAAIVDFGMKVDNSELFSTQTVAHMWAYQNNHMDCRFVPNYLARFPLDLTDDSGNGTLDPTDTSYDLANPDDSVTIDAVNNLWSPHSVALINMNAASRLVKAAVFYAPINVSYQCEGSLSNTEHGWSQSTNEVEDNNDSSYDRDGRPFLTDYIDGFHGIGVRGPCFNETRMTENGIDYTSNANVQVNRLMSMRDAMKLAFHYDMVKEDEDYDQTFHELNGDERTEILNFDDFKTFLSDYRKNTRGNSATGDEIIYERAEIIPLKKSTFFTDKTRYVINFDETASDNTTGIIYYGKNSNSDTGNSAQKVQALFYDNEDPFNNDPLWVSMYWPDSGNFSQGDDWRGGYFLEDYIERTLPHIFSCVRRLPGYLGAPLALTSPYMIVEPYAAVDPISNTWPRDNFEASSYTYSGWGSSPPSQHSSTLDNKYKEWKTLLGRQPKISVEDLVTRHSLPKVCFLSNGIFDISSVGQVKDDQGEIVAKTTITVQVQIFETKYFRYQDEFVELMERNQDSTNDIKYVSNTSSPSGQGSFDDWWIGPETKIKIGSNFDITDSSDVSTVVTQDQRVASKYWLTCGLTDDNLNYGSERSPSNAQQSTGYGAGYPNDDYVKAWDLFIDSRIPNNMLYSEVVDFDGLKNDPDVLTILPDYNSVTWQSTMAKDTRVRIARNPYAWLTYLGSNGLKTDTGFKIGYYTYKQFPTHANLSQHGLPTPNLESINSDMSLYQPDTDTTTSKEDMTKHSSWASASVFNSRDSIDAMSTTIGDADQIKNEFARKFQDRLLMPMMSSLFRRSFSPSTHQVKDGRMENANEYLWAKLDGSDMDPYGQGVFHTANGNGKFVDLFYNSQPYYINNLSDSYTSEMTTDYFNEDKDGDGIEKDGHVSETFKDIMYWQLSNKLKQWEATTSVFDSTVADVVIDSNNDKDSNGILDIYDLPNVSDNGSTFNVNQTNSPFDADQGDTNPTGISFHRGFMSAWYRIPTSYPFATPVLSNLYSWKQSDDNFDNIRALEGTGLYKNILSLHVLKQDYWDADDNDYNIFNEADGGMLEIDPNFTFIKHWPFWQSHGTNDALQKGAQDGRQRHSRVMPRTGWYPVDINVGYYSGFDKDFTFDHGIVGYYFTATHSGGVVERGVSTSKFPKPSGGLTDNNQHPLMFQVDNEGHKPKYDNSANGNPYYGKSHGYYWDYDHMRPTPYDFESFNTYTDSYNRTYSPPQWFLDYSSSSDNIKYELGSPFNLNLTRGGIAATRNKHSMIYASVGFPYNGLTSYGQARYHGYDVTIYWNETVVWQYTHQSHVTYGPQVGRYVPLYHMMWNMDPYQQIDPTVDNYDYTTQNGDETDDQDSHAYDGPTYDHVAYAPSLTGRMWWFDEADKCYAIPPLHNMIYASHTDPQVFANKKTDIKHKLSMNASPECAPGSWHRVYAFWYMRFNIGSMGQSVSGLSAQQGDSELITEDWAAQAWTGSFPAIDPALALSADPVNVYYKGGTGGYVTGTQSRYADDDNNILDTFATDAAFDVDGLDQFGIWFRDDSNYSDISGASINFKPTFFVHTQSNRWHFKDLGRPHMRYDHTMHLAIGKTSETSWDLKGGGYLGEDLSMLHANDNNSFAYGGNLADGDMVLVRFPGYIMNSSVDNVIFGYGSTMSEPGHSYFRGCFHNANWLAAESDAVDPSSIHADEARYNIKPGTREPQLSLDFSNSINNDPIVPDDSTILHIGTRIYHPHDTIDVVSGEYNVSELLLNVTNDDNDVPLIDHGTTDSSLADAPWIGSSKNFQDHFFKGLKTSSSTKMLAQFTYTGLKRMYDDTEGSTDVQVSSTLINYNQDTGAGSIYQVSGDSFTNISYIQEVSVRYTSPEGFAFFQWNEN